MELMFLVWLVDLLVTLDNAIGGVLDNIEPIFALTIVGCVVGFMFYGMIFQPDGETMVRDLKKVFSIVKTSFKKRYIIIPLVLAWLIPSPKVMMYMGGAYLAQSTFESDFVQETATLSQKAVINQLTLWSEEAPELNEVLESLGVDQENIKEKDNTTNIKTIDKILHGSRYKRS